MNSHNSLGYANGFEYVRYNGRVCRADYANKLDEAGYRTGMHDYNGTLPLLSDSEGNDIETTKEHTQMIASVHWFYVSQGYRYPRGFRKVLCPDGVRRYARATAQSPDTFFSHPASITVRGTTISGFVTSRDTEQPDLEFIAYTYGKNGAYFTK